MPQHPLGPSSSWGRVAVHLSWFSELGPATQKPGCEALLVCSQPGQTQLAEKQQAVLWESHPRCENQLDCLRAESALGYQLARLPHLMEGNIEIQKAEIIQSHISWDSRIPEAVERGSKKEIRYKGRFWEKLSKCRRNRSHLRPWTRATSEIYLISLMVMILTCPQGYRGNGKAPCKL